MAIDRNVMTCGETRGINYTYKLVNISCLPSSDNFNIIMDLSVSIEDDLPYLAAHLSGCTYIHGTKVLKLMDAGHIVAVYPTQITITDVRGSDEAEELCAKYHRIISEVRKNRSSIDPVYSKRPSVTVLDIFYSLPKTNCGLCGSITCMAFAARVFIRESPISSCPPLMAESMTKQPFFDRLEANGYHIYD